MRCPQADFLTSLLMEAYGVLAVTGEEPPTCSGREEEHLGGGTTEQTALDARSY